MTLSIIAAVSDNNVIGRGGDLPWRLRADLRRFKALTTGHTVIVGRKTHESIVRRLGRPLPDRRTIVLSRTPGRAEGCEVVTSWDEALERVRGEDEGFVIGGAEIYRLALPHADRIYLTRVHVDVRGDAFFPPFDRRAWQVVRQERHPRNADNQFDVMFEDLVRVKTAVQTR